MKNITCHDCEKFSDCWLRIELENIQIEANKRLWLSPNIAYPLYDIAQSCDRYTENKTK